MRLELSRLESELASGFPLKEKLIVLANLDAENFTCRKNRRYQSADFPLSK